MKEGKSTSMPDIYPWSSKYRQQVRQSRSTRIHAQTSSKRTDAAPPVLIALLVDNPRHLASRSLLAPQ